MTNPRPSRIALGLFLTGFVTLFFEALLTRLFSVTMWYHFAFLAISVAMFGLSAGGAVVYAAPRFFRQELAGRQMAFSVLVFAVAGLVSLVLHLRQPFVPFAESFLGLLGVARLFFVLSVPFFFLGIALCVALTRFAESVGRLYAADLAGAAMGSLAFLFVLNRLDPFAAAFLIFCVACLASLCFCPPDESPRLRAFAATLALAFLGFAVVQTFAPEHDAKPLRILYSKGKADTGGIAERWNAYSRIKVEQYSTSKMEPFGWGFSTELPPFEGIEQLYLTIDSTALTVLTSFDGDLAPLDYLKYDISNLAHRLRTNADVAVMGVGGGRDILSALVYRQRSVDGIEYNSNVLAMLTTVFGDYTGHLDRRPDVELHLDDARRYLTRTEKRYDIIQASLVDTWAATAAGAYTFAENGLYTIDGWSIFLGRLKPEGIVSFSRWYDPENPGEVHRLAAVVGTTLRAMGADDPRRHVAILATPPWQNRGDHGVATLLASRQPLSAETLAQLHASVEELNFDVLYAPDQQGDRQIASLLGSADAAARVVEASPLNLSAPTDNSPFFFNMLRPEDFLSWHRANRGAILFNMRAVFVLGSLIVLALIVHTICLFPPMIAAGARSSRREAATLLFYFTGIGLAFMLTEIGLLQRLTIFLGHPTHSLLLVLPALLIGSSLGSFLSQAGGVDASSRRVALAGLLLVVCLGGLALGLDPLARALGASGEVPRLLAAGGVCLIPGVFMGICFPLGMRVANGRAAWLTPWLWAVNGTASVLASALGLAIAMFWGSAVVFVGGAIAYALSFAAILSLGGLGEAAASAPSS